MAQRPITPEETAQVDELVARGRERAARVRGRRRRPRSTACARPSHGRSRTRRPSRASPAMGVEESGIGDPVSRVGKRFKVMGILRDVLRQPSVGVIEELPERGIVKYAKPVGAHRLPRPDDEPRAHAAGRRHVRHQVPRRRRSSRPIRAAAGRPGRRSRSCGARSRARARRRTCCNASRRPSIPAAQYLMTQADLVQATGGRDMVKAAYSSGTPAYGVGAGNSTMVIDETADVAEAARNTRLSKTSDFGSGCSADGNLVVEASIYDALRAALVDEGGHLASPAETDALRGDLLGCRGSPDARHDRDLRPGARGRGGLRDRAPTGGSSSSSRRRSGRTTPSARRSWASCWRCSATRGSSRRSTWSGRSTRSAARAIRAASTRSTTTTSTGSHGSRR